jgi:hypothetical protein
VANVGTISVSSTANGASITSGVLNLAPADGTNGGIVTNSTQTFAGAKTFNADLTVSRTITATGFITPSGISTQFLKADGSVDTSSYISKPALTGNLFNSIAIGYVAGSGGQGAHSIAIGSNVAQGAQADGGVGVGFASAQYNQGQNAVALGTFAGQYSQGQNAIAVGNQAGLNGQPANSVILNASGNELDASDSGFYVKPIRSQSAINSLYYNPTSGEITYNTTVASGVPYSGAAGAVDLGAYDLKVNGLTIGLGAGQNSQNTAIGNNALSSSLSNGERNTAVGYDAMLNYVGTSFDNNTSVGYFNMVGLTTGSANTSVGGETMFGVGSGSNNTAIGNHSLINITNSDKNTALGANAGATVTSGSSNTLLGFSADVGTGTLTNATAIGSQAIVTASNTIQLGNTSVSNVNTSGTITAGAVTYPNADGTSGQVLTANGSGTPTWSSPAAGVPYTGATAPVNLGNNNLSTTGTITGNVSVSTEITNSFTISSANATTYNSKLLVCNPGALITITIDNSNPIPVGFNIMVVQKSSAANTISFTAGNNATVINRLNFTATAGQYALVTLVYIGNGMFITSGDMQ